MPTPTTHPRPLQGNPLGRRAVFARRIEAAKLADERAERKVDDMPATRSRRDYQDYLEGCIERNCMPTYASLEAWNEAV